jgi:hypothetical protein
MTPPLNLYMWDGVLRASNMEDESASIATGRVGRSVKLTVACIFSTISCEVTSGGCTSAPEGWGETLNYLRKEYAAVLLRRHSEAEKHARKVLYPPASLARRVSFNCLRNHSTRLFVSLCLKSAGQVLHNRKSSLRKKLVRNPVCWCRKRVQPRPSGHPVNHGEKWM